MCKVKEIVMKALDGKIHQYACANTEVLKFQQEVVDTCKMNYCGMYGRTWMCPPGVGELEDLKKKILGYPNFLVFTTKHDIEDSFDIEGMGLARDEHKKLEALLLKVLKGENYLLLSAGGCNICEKCTYPSAPCRFPERANPSMEACGINVVELSRDVNINYVNGENTVTYFSLVLY